MEADARTLIALVGPLAVAYMTYSSVSATAPGSTTTDAKGVSFSQLAPAPKLPSAEHKLRNPFVPARGTGAAAPLVDAEDSADPEKNNDPLRLDGTAMIGKIRFAIINGMRVTEGDYFRGMRLTKVEATQITLTSGEGADQIVPLTIAKSDKIEIPARVIEHDSAPKRPSAPARKTTSSKTGSESGTAQLMPGAAKTTTGSATGSKSATAKAGAKR